MEQVMIFPTPKAYEAHEGAYAFKKALPAEELLGFYKAALTSRDIRFLTCDALSAEGYKMEIGEGGILITSATEEGAFRAVTSLFQLYKKGKTCS